MQPASQVELRFSAQAFSGLHSWWRVLITLVLTVGALLLGSLGMVWRLMQSEAYRQRGLDIGNFSPEVYDIQPELFVVLLLLPFVVGLLVFVGCIHWIHRRPWQSLIRGRSGSIRWQRMMISFLLWMILLSVFELLAFWRGHVVYTSIFDLERLLAGLAVVAVLLPLQVAFEELTIRGYFHQLISKWTHRPWLAVIISSTLFAVLHLQNPEVLRFGASLMLSYYFLVGCYLAVLSVMDDGLELALGIHLATNVFGAVVVNYEGSVLPMRSLWVASGMDLRNELMIFFAQALLFAIVFRSVLTKAPVAPGSAKQPTSDSWRIQRLWRL